jgi:hypothetical protein
MDAFEDVDLRTKNAKQTDASIFADVAIGSFKCSHCGTETQTPMKQCQCRKVQYHSEKCQDEHWAKQHSKECTAKPVE